MTNPAAQTAKNNMLGLKPLPAQSFQDSDFVSFGITLLNLACYGRTFGGVPKGRVLWLRGRASGGKTFVARNILCEAALNPEFNAYQLIYDDVEHGALMDTEKFWPPLVKRLVPPCWIQNSQTKVKRPGYSRNIEEFYSRVKKKLDAGKPFIWIEDSMDALGAVIKKDAEGNEKINKMSDGKAKANSQDLRRIMDPLYESGSILCLISQARMNFAADSMFNPDISAGGRALEHYPSVTVTLRPIKTIMREHKGKKWPIGATIQAKVEKNRVTGLPSVIYFPIYFNYGIDDVGSCIDWLCTAASHWNMTGGIITAPELNFEGSRWELIKHVETKGLLKQLRTVTGNVWQEIQEAINVKRMPRYS